MSEHIRLAFVAMILLLVVVFAETFLSTKYRQLEYKTKVLTQKLKKSHLRKNQLEHRLSTQWEEKTLLNELPLKHYKKALPNDIPVIKFQNPDTFTNRDHFVQR